jgi:hypothetical protein
MSASIPKTAADFETITAAPIEVGATSFTLSSATDEDGVALASGLYAFTIDGDTDYKEFVIGSLSGTTVSSVYHVSVQNVATSGTATYHRQGASVAITDWVAIGRLTAAARGDAGYDASAPLYYDAAPTFSTDNQIVTKKYVDDTVNGGTVSFQNQVLASQTAGENLTANDSVYLKESDQRWYKTDADLTATFDGLKRGIAVSTQTTGNTLSILIAGIQTGFVGLTAGAKYYASNTAGAISSTPGTYTVFVGTALSTTTLLFDQYQRDIPTGAQKDALAGTQGVPNSSNKYVTNDNTSAATTDQSQLTANSTQIFGAASTTGLQNRLAQSFIPAKTKIRGVNLDKDADTGTFTGTVTVSIQSDSSGEPDGVALATVTITNATWLATPVGVFEALFASETSLTVGTTYWIVAETSTADTANHPNLGANSAGGYTSGSVKYYNATDDWVAIPTIDLYFATLEGDNSQLVKTNSSGVIAVPFLSAANMGTDRLVGTNRAGYTKTFFNAQLPFGLWTGTSDGATDTTFDNWITSSITLALPTGGGAFCQFQGSNAASIYLSVSNGPFYGANGNTIRFDSSNVVIMDWNVAFSAFDEGVFMGFSDDAATAAIAAYTATASRAIAFVMNGSTLYTKTCNATSATLTSIATLTTGTYYNLRIEADLGADSVTYYLNGQNVGTVTSTFPSNTNPITPTFGRQDDATFIITAPNVSIELNP